MTYELTSDILRFRLQECLEAGRQLEHALPEIALQANSGALRRLLLGRVGHIRFRRDLVSDALTLLAQRETNDYQRYAEENLPWLSRTSESEPCEALERLLAEARLIVEMTVKPATRDAALLAILHRIAAYEADCCSCALDLAFNLAEEKITELLREIAQEENAFVRKVRDFEESSALAAN